MLICKVTAQSSWMRTCRIPLICRHCVIRNLIKLFISVQSSQSTCSFLSYLSHDSLSTKNQDVTGLTELITRISENEQRFKQFQWKMRTHQHFQTPWLSHMSMSGTRGTQQWIKVTCTFCNWVNLAYKYTKQWKARLRLTHWMQS